MTPYRFLLGLVFASGLVSHVYAQERLTFGHSGRSGTLFDVSARQFAEVVNDRLRRRVQIDVIGDRKLGGEFELVKLLRSWKVDLTLTASAIARIVPEFALFEMPYLIRDRDHMRRIEEKIVWPILDPIAQKHGYKIIGVWESGFRHITNNSRPIKSPFDLKGMRLRTLRSKWNRITFGHFGASPVAIPLSETFFALQKGVIDGQEGPLTLIRETKLYEVQKYLSLTGHIYTPAFLIMGLDRWNALDYRTQNGILDAARETQGFVYETAARMDEEALKEIQAMGVEVNEVDREAFAGKSKIIYDKFARSVDNGYRIIIKVLQVAR